MVPRHPLLEVHIREQFTRPHIRTAHRCLPLFPPPAWNQIRSSMSAVHFFSSLLGFGRVATPFLRDVFLARACSFASVFTPLCSDSWLPDPVTLQLDSR